MLVVTESLPLVECVPTLDAITRRAGGKESPGISEKEVVVDFVHKGPLAGQVRNVEDISGLIRGLRTRHHNVADESIVVVFKACPKDQCLTWVYEDVIFYRTVIAAALGYTQTDAEIVVYVIVRGAIIEIDSVHIFGRIFMEVVIPDDVHISVLLRVVEEVVSLVLVIARAGRIGAVILLETPEPASAPGIEWAVVGCLTDRVVNLVELDSVSAAPAIVDADSSTGQVIHQVVDRKSDVFGK